MKLKEKIGSLYFGETEEPSVTLRYSNAVNSYNIMMNNRFNVSNKYQLVNYFFNCTILLSNICYSPAKNSILSMRVVGRSWE